MQKLTLPCCLLLLLMMSACNRDNDWQAAPTQIEVVASGTTATLTVYANHNGDRRQLLRTEAFVGRRGCSPDKREGDGKTPVGVFEIKRAFGLAPAPAMSIAYTQLSGGEVWVDDVASSRYNQWVATVDGSKDWNSAEDLSKQVVAYQYVAIVEYNTTNIVKGNGSAIFLHCTEGKPTSGCISVPKESMMKILEFIQPGTRIAVARSAAELQQLVD